MRVSTKGNFVFFHLRRKRFCLLLKSSWWLHFKNLSSFMVTITNKASGGDGISGELFKLLKDDAIKVLYSVCQQIWKNQQWPQDWKGSVFIPVPKKGTHLNKDHPSIQMANKLMKRCLTLLIIRDMQIKTTMRYHISQNAYHQKIYK